MAMKTQFLVVLVVAGLLLVSRAEARNFTLEGENAYSGGIGFQAGLSDWTPGGFKFFNDYSRELTDFVWLNFQLNGTLGNMDRKRCWYEMGIKHCDYHYHNWHGGAVAFAIGVKLVWDLKKLPIQVYGKIGGAVDILFLGDTYTGIAFGVRSGVGAHFFFLSNFGVGLELMSTLGPSVIPDGPGAEFYAALDLQVIGIEYRW